MRARALIPARFESPRFESRFRCFGVSEARRVRDARRRRCRRRCARRHAARETSAAHKAPAGGFGLVFFCITRPRATSERLPVSRSSSRRRRGRSVRVYRAPRRGEAAFRTPRATLLARSRRVRAPPRRRSSSKTYAAASLGFAGHDAPGSPCASAFFAARRKRVTTSSTSRGSRVAHASTSHDGGGGRLRRAHRTGWKFLHTDDKRKSFVFVAFDTTNEVCNCASSPASRAAESHSGARRATERRSSSGATARAVGASGWQTWRRRCPTPTSA